MDITDAIIRYRRYLKRRNYSAHTVRNYMNMLKHYVVWLDVPLQEATPDKMAAYIDYLLYKRLKPKTINCHLTCISAFYQHLCYEQGIAIANPIRRGCTLRQPKPLPRYVRDEELCTFFKQVTSLRDRAMFMAMLRCGLRVEETASLTLAALDLARSQLIVRNGKGAKDRLVYISSDTREALAAYLAVRPPCKAKRVFLVEKGTCRGKPISVRGIQKRIEQYRRKAGLSLSCHQLRHTMATQLLNADADLATIQDLLGHNWITTTQRYCTVSNLKVQRDYYAAMDVVLQRTAIEKAEPG